ncbi:hypothetical protein CEXT_73071 [Caerostris extrusa]|uniref:Uncharacterized protein n=1 Tax=Caerostris extrusa TaxID=172846 RepID=A0AAV4NCR7_CAEEX|nr:hypothetical protein CEXT_73071 [Caerostris extrusa]
MGLKIFVPLSRVLPRLSKDPSFLSNSSYKKYTSVSSSRRNKNKTMQLYFDKQIFTAKYFLVVFLLENFLLWTGNFQLFLKLLHLEPSFARDIELVINRYCLVSIDLCKLAQKINIALHHR